MADTVVAVLGVVIATAAFTVGAVCLGLVWATEAAAWVCAVLASVALTCRASNTCGSIQFCPTVRSAQMRIRADVDSG